MPKYEIHCVECNKDYEVEKSYSDNTPFSCPKGHTKRIVKKIRPLTIVYKGNGFTKKVESDE